MPNKVRVYAAGGAATNILSAFFAKDEHLIQGGSDLEVCYIDTSRSNSNPDIKPEQLYIVETPDSRNGSGKNRSTNAKPIKESVNDILLQFKPEKFNIVVASTGGGTGSVAAPLLVSELLRRGEVVIVISIGTYGSKKEVENSLKTLASYEGASQQAQRPLAMSFFENGAAAQRPSVDKRVQTMVKIISVLLSGHNHGLDDEDVTNFLDFQKVTSFHPHLVYMDAFQEKIEVAKGTAVISVASLTTEKVGADVDVMVGYQCEGMVPPFAIESIGGKVPVHIVTVGGHFSGVIDRITARLAEFEAVEKAVQARAVKVSGADDDGLVL
jgi:hypothetical protein